MTARHIGALLIAAGCAIFGFTSAGELSKHIRLLDALCASLRLMSAELETRLCPLPELIGVLADRGGAAAGFFAELSFRLPQLGEEDLYDIWSGSLRCLCLLEKDELSALEELGAVLGRYELNEQLTSIDMCLNTLCRKAERLREELPERRRLLLGLSSAAGIMVLIVLI